MNIQCKQPVMRVTTCWGKNLLVGVDDLKDNSQARLLIRNQFGYPVKVKDSKGIFQAAPKSIYRDSLVLH